MKTPDIKPRRDYAAPALERALDILEALADRGTGMTISEIAGVLARSVSEVFRIIIVMERRGWLRKDADRYSTSYRVLDVAYRSTPAQSLTTVAAPYMAALASAVSQSCHLVIRANDKGLVIHREENAGPVGFAMRTGAVIDLLSSCSGHVLLAFGPDSSDGPQTPGDDLLAPQLGKLKPHLATVRERGYELQPSARASGVTDISVPIFGFTGALVAALTVPCLALLDGMTPPIDEVREQLIATGARISTAMGAYKSGC